MCIVISRNDQERRLPSHALRRIAPIEDLEGLEPVRLPLLELLALLPQLPSKPINSFEIKFGYKCEEEKK